MLNRLRAIPQKEPVVLFNMALTAEVLGEREQALTMLEEAVEHGLTEAYTQLHGRWLEPLMEEPRFQALFR